MIHGKTGIIIFVTYSSMLITHKPSEKQRLITNSPIITKGSLFQCYFDVTLYKVRYRQTSNIKRTSLDIKLFDYSDVVGASPVGAAPTTSSFSS